MMESLIGLFLLVIALGVMAQSAFAIEEVWQDGWLTGVLTRVKDSGERIYHVSLAPDASDADGTPYAARDYACALLLAQPDARVKLISDTEFELTVELGGSLPQGLIPVSPVASGLQVLNGEQGAYLTGDMQHALSLRGGMPGPATAQIPGAPVPLSDGDAAWR